MARLFRLVAILMLTLAPPALGTVDPAGDVPNLTASADQVVLDPDGMTVALKGEIVEGTAARLRNLIASRPALRRISLTSEGGYVFEAEAVAALVAERRLETYVPRYCVSACTLIFVRGSERLAEPGARFGFHAPYLTDEAGAEIQVEADDERRSYIAAGIDADFAGEALRVAAADIWFPEPARLIAARVVTRFLGGSSEPAGR